MVNDTISILSKTGVWVWQGKSLIKNLVIQGVGEMQLVVC